MNPLELEIYHQIKNVIGVNPSFYEYIFMVDADTTVEQMSLNRLVSAMMHDKKIIGICGETSIANAKQSIVTMAQVYEYFISHHLAKAFESLFGSITCLPGCFSMYRLRTPDTHKPLFISNQIINDYSENRVDTLHLKNLLHLGEDRYLTTLVLKHFPTYKTKFVRDAQAETVAPDSAKVLLSQRRRWINSTVHNLAELVFLDQLCGFCCFSMRFVVFIDLLSTVVAPVTVAYVSPHALTRLMRDWIPDISRYSRPFNYTNPLHRNAGRYLWSPSPHLHLPHALGHDRLDGLLHPCDPGVLVLLTPVFVLEDGRL